MGLPDIQFEAERFVEKFDRLMRPIDQEHKLFGHIGAFSLVGMTIYSPEIRGIAWQVKKRILNHATRRYVRAVRANYPNEINPDSSFIAIRRHAGLYSGNSDNYLSNEEGNI